jgi:hypothetical protein
MVKCFPTKTPVWFNGEKRSLLNKWCFNNWIDVEEKKKITPLLHLIQILRGHEDLNIKVKAISFQKAQ